MKTVRFLFNDAMARAIVEGRKTVTRRPVIPQPAEWPSTGEGLWRGGRRFPHDGGPDPLATCAPGDILFGRECWRAFGGISDVRVDYRAGGESSIIGREVERIGGSVVHYLPDVSRLERPGGKWRPSIHMPDWAARIRRRVVSVSVERLQDITNKEAIAEGIEYDVSKPNGWPIDRFMAAWDSIYSAKGLGWDVNPWVWRIEFSAEDVAQDVAP